MRSCRGRQPDNTTLVCHRDGEYSPVSRQGTILGNGRDCFSEQVPRNGLRRIRQRKIAGLQFNSQHRVPRLASGTDPVKQSYQTAMSKSALAGLQSEEQRYSRCNEHL
jgi:hypothetical protein